MMDEELLTVKEAAELLRLCPSTIYRLLRRRLLPGHRIGNSWRLVRAQLLDWRSEDDRRHLLGRKREGN